MPLLLVIKILSRPRSQKNKAAIHHYVNDQGVDDRNWQNGASHPISVTLHSAIDGRWEFPDFWETDYFHLELARQSPKIIVVVLLSVYRMVGSILTFY